MWRYTCPRLVSSFVLFQESSKDGAMETMEGREKGEVVEKESKEADHQEVA